jgi:hypothetical protein
MMWPGGKWAESMEGAGVELWKKEIFQLQHTCKAYRTKLVLF